MKHHSRTSMALITAIAVICTVLVSALTPASNASWTSASLRMPGSAKAGSVSMTYVASGVTCVAAPVTNCASQSFPSTPGSQGPSSVTATLTNTGTRSGSYTQSVQFTDCRPLKLDNARNANGFLIARGGITRQVADRWGTQNAARFDGLNDSISGLAAAPTGTFGSGSWSMGVWLRAAPGTVGTSLLGASVNPQTAGPRGGAPALRLLNDGRVRFEWFSTLGALTGATWTAPSLRDGQWHFVVVSVEKSLLSSSITLLIDSVPQQAFSNLSLLSSTSDPYKWHIGWIDPSGSAFPNNPHFTGDLSGAFFKPSTTSASQAQALFQATSATSYQSVLSAQGASDIWMLGDSRDNRYLGSLSYVDSPGDPCYFIYASVLANGVNIVPGMRLTELIAASSGGTVWSATQPAPNAGSSGSVANWVGRTPVFDVDVANLELQISYAHRMSLTGSQWSAIARWDAVNVVA